MTYPPQPDSFRPQQRQQPPHVQRPGFTPVQPAVYRQHTVAHTGLPGWMHALYAVATVFTCGLAGIAWGIHWWVVQSKSKATTTYQPMPPPQQPRY